MSVEKEKRLGKHPIVSVVDGARVLREWSTIQERGDQRPVMGISPARGMKSLLDKCVGLPKREVEPIIQQNFKHKHLVDPVSSGSRRQSTPSSDMTATVGAGTQVRV